MFSQTTIDPSIMLGSSLYPANKFGCTATDVAQALVDAGWNVDLNGFFHDLNRVGAFNSDGLLIWSKVSEIYPAFHFHADDSGAYKFRRGTWNGHSHWVMQDSNGTFDPWYGKRVAPAGFVYSGDTNRTASIDQNHNHPSPDPVPAAGTYVVKSGDTLTSICQVHYGITDPTAAYRKALEVAQYNGIADPNRISVGQTIKLP